MLSQCSETKPRGQTSRMIADRTNNCLVVELAAECSNDAVGRQLSSNKAAKIRKGSPRGPLRLRDFASNLKPVQEISLCMGEVIGLKHQAEAAA